jgi:hypothetical protein
LLRASGFLESFQGAWDLAHDDAIRTVWLAVSAATLATIFAIVLARLASRAGLGSMLGALGAGLAVPASIVGLGLIVLWNHEPVIFVYQSGVIVGERRRPCRARSAATIRVSRFTQCQTGNHRGVAGDVCAERDRIQRDAAGGAGR